MISIAPLERLLVEKDMTITFLSQVSGIEISVFSCMKEGKCITRKNIETICKVLKCQPSDVIEFQKTETKGHWEYIENTDE